MTDLINPIDVAISKLRPPIDPSAPVNDPRSGPARAAPLPTIELNILGLNAPSAPAAPINPLISPDLIAPNAPPTPCINDASTPSIPETAPKPPIISPPATILNAFAIAP